MTDVASREVPVRTAVAAALCGAMLAAACSDPYGGGSAEEDAAAPRERDAAIGDGPAIEASPPDAGPKGCRARGAYLTSFDDNRLHRFDLASTKVTPVGPIDCKVLLAATEPNTMVYYGAFAIGRDGFARMFANVSGPSTSKRYLLRVALDTGVCVPQVTPIAFSLEGLAAVRESTSDVFYGTAYDVIDGKKGEYLYAVDPSAGTRTALGAIHTADVNATVTLLDSTDERLFGIRRIEGLDHEIYEIDRKTGAILSKTPAKFNGSPNAAIHTRDTTWLFITPPSKPGPPPELWTFDPATKGLARVADNFVLSARGAGVDVACD